LFSDPAYRKLDLNQPSLTLARIGVSFGLASHAKAVTPKRQREGGPQ
jgi:hypothetical protein